MMYKAPQMGTGPASLMLSYDAWLLSTKQSKPDAADVKGRISTYKAYLNTYADLLRKAAALPEYKFIQGLVQTTLKDQESCDNYEAILTVVADSVNAALATQPQEDTGLQLDPRQQKIAGLLLDIGMYSKKLVPLAKRQKTLQASLSAKNFDTLFAAVQGLMAVLEATVATPLDILDPASLKDPKEGETVSMTLDAAIPFLEAILQIAMDNADCLSLQPMGIFDIVLSTAGKQCITSMAGDVNRLFQNHVIQKKQ